MQRRLSVPIAVLVVLTGLVTLDVLAGGPLRDHLDPAVQEWVLRHVHGGWHAVALGLLQTGQRYVLAVPLVVLAVLVARRLRRWRPIIVGAATVIAVAVLVGLAKTLVGRTAPASGRDAVLAGASSFPSGHSVNGLVLWTLALAYLAVLVPWFTRRRRIVIAALTGLAAGLGTIGMDYHWATDVLAGWALGALGCLLVLAVDPAREARPSASPSTAEPETVRAR